MASIEEIRGARLAKLKLLQDKGINPYPVSSHPTHTLKEAVEKFNELETLGKPATLVGRILSIRAQGKIVFFTFDDGTGKFQALLKHEEPTPKEDFELFTNAFDIGDFVEVTGKLFLTKKEEKTILGEGVRMLGKTLRPLPEKWHGLGDVEERFRKRYLDLISNEGVKERFIIRSKIVSEMRRILDDAGYVEVETPALQPIYGGATAEPFITHHKALDTDLYLRISDELYLKRLLAGGMPKVYEIARDFRNEGIDSTHNPEFTMLEFYEAYSDALKQRAFVEEMIRTLAEKVLGKMSLEWDGEEIHFGKAFDALPYYSLFEKFLGIDDVANLDDADLRDKAEKLEVKVEEGDSRYKVMDNIYKKAIRPKLVEPTFIIDYPENYLPLAKKIEGKDGIVDAFQLVIGGVELVKAFSELNDPL
ncbi:MAG: amino acid--tRNA ligase-related protein, partial [Parcubacteria group bacterium]